MPSFAGALETAYQNYEATGQKLLEVVRSSEAAAGLEELVATTVAHEAAAGTLTVETLRRYLSAAEEDREAAADRAAEAAVRSRRLIIAIVCLGLVVGATNVALAVRRPNVFQTYNVAPARPAEVAAAAAAPPAQVRSGSAEASQMTSILPAATAPTVCPGPEVKKDALETGARPVPASAPAMAPRPARVRAVVLPKDEERDDSVASRTVAERW